MASAKRERAESLGIYCRSVKDFGSLCSLLFSPNLRLESVLQALLDLLVRFVHLLVGEGAVGRLITQGESQTFRSGRNAFTFVEIEQTNVAKQIAARSANLCHYLLG